jgi:CubicO group peptidase (beta-lactamase class C family)
VSDGAVRTFLERRVAAGWFPGAAWWLESGGRATWGVTGDAALEPVRIPLVAGMPFDLASLTKPLATALLLVLLEQDRAFDLDEPVACVVDELAGTPWERTTPLELATHRSGLPAWKPLYLEAASRSGYLRALRAVPRVVEPGRTVYSDLGYIVLGAWIERVAGASLGELFARMVAGPLGLTRAGFPAPDRRFDDAAATERANDYERRLVGEAGADHAWRSRIVPGEVHDANAHALGGVAGHAGLFATIEEVAALAREILAPVSLALGDRARRRLVEPAAGSVERTVGFVLARASRAARGILDDEAPGHTGFTGTSLWLDVSRGRFYVLLSHRVHPRVGPRDFQLVRRGFHRIGRRFDARHS